MHGLCVYAIKHGKEVVRGCADVISVHDIDNGTDQSHSSTEKLHGLLKMHFHCPFHYEYQRHLLYPLSRFPFAYGNCMCGRRIQLERLGFTLGNCV